jgi:hypothetical protein
MKEPNTNVVAKTWRAGLVSTYDIHQTRGVKMSNYPEGSMMGSGIYAQEVSFDEFECENEECGKTNEAGDTTTDDYGNYAIECEFCGATYRESSLADDYDEGYADANFEDYRDSQRD